jgi:hypothetical protein
MRRTLPSMICWIAVVAFAAPVLGQNLIVNGNFDSSTSSWNFTTPGTFTHNPSLDADGSPTSGSGQLANTSPVAFGTSFAAQCITTGISGGSAYDWGAQIRFDTGNTQTATGRANVVVSFFDGASCSGSNLGGFTTPNYISSTTDVWAQNEILNVVAPAGAVSAQLSLFTNKVEDSGTITVNFDNVVFGPAGILPVELERFVVE